MKQKTHEVLRFIINKVLLVVSSLFTVLLFVNLSSAWYGQVAMGILAVSMEFSKWLLAAWYKRDRKKWQIVLFGLGFALSILSTTAFRLAEMDAKSQVIADQETMIQENKKDKEVLDIDIAKMKAKIEAKETEILSYEGTAWEKKWFEDYAMPQVNGWKAELKVMEEKREKLKVLLEGEVKTEVQAEEKIDPDKAFRALSFGLIPVNVIKTVLLMILAIWLEIFIFVTTSRLDDEKEMMGLVSPEIPASPPQGTDGEQVPKEPEVSVDISVPEVVPEDHLEPESEPINVNIVPVVVQKIGLNGYMDRLWELQSVKADTSDGAMADDLGIKIADVKKLRLKLMMINWKDGPVLTVRGGWAHLNYEPEMVRKIIQKLEE